MIQANELRIGNYVTPLTADGFPLEERKIKSVQFYALSINPHYAKPIPLTEEWLLRFGFQKLEYEMSGCKVYELPKTHWRVAHAYRENLDSYFLWHKQVSPPTWALTEFKFVHSLQNIIHSLTGEELTLKK